MNRRKFLGALSGGVAAGLSGCVGGRLSTGFLHALLPEDRSQSESELRERIHAEGVPKEKIYINEFMNAMQLRGDYGLLKDLATKLDLREYKLYSVKEYIPIVSDEDDTIELKTSDLAEFALLGELIENTDPSENSSVGMIDTFAGWNSWYEGEDLNHKVVAQNMNPILGPLLRDKDHGIHTARTLFSQAQRVGSEGPYVKGLVSNSSAYHAEISAIVTMTQFFRSLCDSLEWMAQEDVDVIVMPLSTVDTDRTIMARILEEYVQKLTNSIVVVSAGNVDVCNGGINALANSNARSIIGVGSIESNGNGDELLSGRPEVSDVVGPSNFKIGGSMSYSGTSASSTVVAGVLGVYISTLRQEFPYLKQSEYRECAVTGLLETGMEINISDCDSEKVMTRISPLRGLELAREEARSKIN